MTVYNTYRIRIDNLQEVKAEKFKPDHLSKGALSGKLSFEQNRNLIFSFHNQATEGKLNDSQSEKLGELLFKALFDERLKYDFFSFYEQCRSNGQLLRIELDVDEQALPEIAALPWEFLRIVSDRDFGTLMLATAPDVVFVRRKSSWNSGSTCSLKPLEYLRVVLAVAAPEGMGSVQFDKTKSAIEELARKGPVELSAFIEHADLKKIDQVLKEKKPHIFHFIGHGALDAKAGDTKGRIALEDFAGNPEWVGGEKFAELFNRHRPGVVVLQSCETGKMDGSVPFSGIASHLAAQSIPIVAAMQYKVSNGIAGTFSNDFYKALSENRPVDLAIQEGRRAISVAASGSRGWNFATPIIYSRIPNGRLFQRPKLDTNNMADLILKVKQEELGNKNADALKKWKCIRQIDPGLVEAENAVLRLSKKLNETSNLGKLIQQLSGRMKEILPVYLKVASYLKRMETQGVSAEGEIFINVVKNYIDDGLSSQEFMEMWHQTDKKIMNAETELNFRLLTDRLNHGEIIVFLGSGVLNVTGLFDLSAQSITDVLANDARYKQFNGTLAMIAQYCQMRTEYGRNRLIRRVKQKFKQALDNCQPFVFYDMLAQIQKPIMVISACYDNTLEQVFAENKKPFVVISHASEDGELKGRMIVKYWNQDEAEVCTAERLSEYQFLPKGYSIIYKIWGCLSLYNMDAGHASDPMILAENDFFLLPEKWKN